MSVSRPPRILDARHHHYLGSDPGPHWGTSVCTPCPPTIESDRLLSCSFDSDEITHAGMHTNYCRPAYSRCGHYIFALWFLLLSSFFHRLISAVGDWMSTILPHMVCLSAILGCMSEACCTRLSVKYRTKKNCHLGIIAQVCREISLQLRSILTIGKNL